MNKLKLNLFKYSITLVDKSIVSYIADVLKLVMSGQVRATSRTQNPDCGDHVKGEGIV